MELVAEFEDGGRVGVDPGGHRQQVIGLSRALCSCEAINRVGIFLPDPPQKLRYVINLHWHPIRHLYNNCHCPIVLLGRLLNLLHQSLRPLIVQRVPDMNNWEELPPKDLIQHPH